MLTSGHGLSRVVSSYRYRCCGRLVLNHLSCRGDSDLQNHVLSTRFFWLSHPILLALARAHSILLTFASFSRPSFNCPALVNFLIKFCALPCFPLTWVFSRLSFSVAQLNLRKDSVWLYLVLRWVAYTVDHRMMSRQLHSRLCYGFQVETLL